jgi:hypothetical protein
MKTVRVLVPACLAMASMAFAQAPTQTNPSASDSQKPVTVIAQPQGLQPAQIFVQPPFDRLAKLGPDGKIVRIEGILDILAIPRNAYVDTATRERIRPLVQTWMAEVDQLTIDNLDFLEKIMPPDGTPGVIESVNINDTQKLHYVAQMMTQLMSAGPLSNHLEQVGGFNRDQAQRNQEIVSDYLQQVMNEIMAENGVPNDKSKAPTSEADKVKQVNAVSRFLYYISCRDATDSYLRQLAAAAPLMDKVVASLQLTAEQKDKVKAPLAACAAATANADKRKATRALLDQLTFDQRRAALAKARELAGPYDPLAGLPPQGSFPAPAQTNAPKAPSGASPADQVPASQPSAADKPGGQ